MSMHPSNSHCFSPPGYVSFLTRRTGCYGAEDAEDRYVICVHEILVPEWLGPTTELSRRLLWRAGVMIGDAIKQLINDNHDKRHV